jgi:hypothetical protein
MLSYFYHKESYRVEIDNYVTRRNY